MPSLSGGKYRPVKTPTVLQMEGAECGAAALGIILEYHGRYVPLDVLRDDCGVSRDGSNALLHQGGGQAVRPGGQGVPQAGRRAWSRKQPPFIVLWQWNHFLVVEGFGTRQGLPQRSGLRPTDGQPRRNSPAATAASPSRSRRAPSSSKQGRTAQHRPRPGPAAGDVAEPRSRS